MKAIVQPCIHSGIENPKYELSGPKYEEFCKLFYKINGTIDKPNITRAETRAKLGFAGWMVTWDAPFWIHVQDGFIIMYAGNNIFYLDDTVGLDNFLELNFLPLFKKEQADQYDAWQKSFCDSLERIESSAVTDQAKYNDPTGKEK